MNHDHNGTDDDPRDNANRQIEPAQGEVPRVNESTSQKPEQVIQHDGEASEESPILASETYAVHQEYEGILPHPAQFNAYNQNAQEVLLEIARAQVKAAFEDESKRQDKLVNAEIKQGNRGQVFSTIIICLTVSAAIVVALCTGNAIVASLMAGIPLVSIIGNLFRPTKSRPISTSGNQEKKN